MKVIIDSEFLEEELRFRSDYARQASDKVAGEFENAVDEATRAIKFAPAAAGHLVRYPPEPDIPFRRTNLRKFPFFILYVYEPEMLSILTILPSRSNPQNWFRTRS